MQDFETVEQNLRAAMKFFGRATGLGEVRSLDGAEAIYSGLDYGVFNIALLNGRVGKDGTLEDRIAACGRFFKPRASRWSFWVCEELLGAAERKRARQAFSDCGMRAISHPPGMIADALSQLSRALPAIELRRVQSQADRDTFAGITSAAFDIPVAVANAVYRPERAWAGAYQGFIAVAGRRPVAIAASVVGAEALGIYSLATPLEYRRQGYGEALLRAVAAQERQRTGIEKIVLQSTEAGYSLYRRLGFREVARFSVYLTK